VWRTIGVNLITAVLSSDTCYTSQTSWTAAQSRRDQLWYTGTVKQWYSQNMDDACAAYAVPVVSHHAATVSL